MLSPMRLKAIFNNTIYVYQASGASRGAVRRRHVFVLEKLIEKEIEKDESIDGVGSSRSALDAAVARLSSGLPTTISLCVGMRDTALQGTR